MAAAILLPPFLPSATIHGPGVFIISFLDSTTLTNPTGTPMTSSGTDAAFLNQFIETDQSCRRIAYGKNHRLQNPGSPFHTDGRPGHPAGLCFRSDGFIIDKAMHPAAIFRQPFFINARHSHPRIRHNIRTVFQRRYGFFTGAFGKTEIFRIIKIRGCMNTPADDRKFRFPPTRFFP